MKENMELGERLEQAAMSCEDMDVAHKEQASPLADATLWSL